MTAVCISGCGLLPEGVEAAVRLMLPNELALVHCHPEAAYASQPEAAPSGVPPYGYVEFEVELMGFERDSELRDQSAEDCVRSGQAMKEIANNLYKEKKYKLASIKYQKVTTEGHWVMSGVHWEALPKRK